MFRPLQDRVVVRRIDSDAKSAGASIIPDNANEKPSEREIVAVSPGRRDEDGNIVPLDVKVGDRKRSKMVAGTWRSAMAPQ
jgi:chaperonin GroES